MWICDMHRDYRLNIFFFFNDTATTEIYTLPLHDALPISALRSAHGHDPRGAERGPGHPHGVRHRRDDVDLQQQPARALRARRRSRHPPQPAAVRELRGGRPDDARPRVEQPAVLTEGPATHLKGEDNGSTSQVLPASAWIT